MNAQREMLEQLAPTDPIAAEELRRLKRRMGELRGPSKRVTIKILAQCFLNRSSSLKRSLHAPWIPRSNTYLGMESVRTYTNPHLSLNQTEWVLMNHRIAWWALDMSGIFVSAEYAHFDMARTRLNTLPGFWVGPDHRVYNDFQSSKNLQKQGNPLSEDKGVFVPLDRMVNWNLPHVQWTPPSLAVSVEDEFLK
jgi:hypothetical protein